MASWMRASVAGETFSGWFSALDTVPIETPARAATSRTLAPPTTGEVNAFQSRVCCTERERPTDRGNTASFRKGLTGCDGESYRSVTD